MIAKPQTDSPKDSRRGFAVSFGLCGGCDRAGFALAEKPGEVACSINKAEDEGHLLQSFYCPNKPRRCGIQCADSCRSDSLNEEALVKCAESDSEVRIMLSGEGMPAHGAH